jgi:scyllo-inositol 2-dehydrogenase (NADP+)
LNTEIDGAPFIDKIETIPGNYLGYYQNIYEAIREGNPLAVTGEDGKNVIQLIEAAIKSNKEKREISY